MYPPLRTGNVLWPPAEFADRGVTQARLHATLLSDVCVYFELVCVAQRFGVHAQRTLGNC